MKEELNLIVKTKSLIENLNDFTIYIPRKELI